MDEHKDEDRIMQPHEVAELAAVDPKTVTRWAVSGKLPFFRTLGGHRRFKEKDVLAALGMASTDRTMVEK